MVMSMERVKSHGVYKSDTKKGCAAVWCQSYSRSRLDRRISFFGFPKDEERSQKWIKFCLREDLLNKRGRQLRNYYICSDHFEAKDFKTLHPRPLLKGDAVPSIVEAPLIMSQPRPLKVIPISVDVFHGAKRKEVYQNIDTQEADFGLMPTELKEEQEELTTGELIGLDEQSSDCLPLHTVSSFYSSSFGNIPMECGVDCIINESVPDVQDVQVTTPVVPLDCPHLSASKPIPNTPPSVPAECTNQESTLFSAPGSPVPSTSNSTEVAPMENNAVEEMVQTSQGAERDTELVALQDDLSSSNESIFSVAASPSPPPSQPFHVTVKAVEDIGIEMLMRSFFANSGSGKPVFLTDPYYKYKLCRLCFKAGEKLTYIFGGSYKRFDLKNAIEDLLHFKVSKSDNYPHQVCDRCLSKLVKFKQYKDQCRKDKELFDEELKKQETESSQAGDLSSSQIVNQDEPVPVCPSNLPEQPNHQSSQGKSVCETILDPPTVSAANALEPALNASQTDGKSLISKDDELVLPMNDSGHDMDSSGDEGGVKNSVAIAPFEPIASLNVREMKWKERVTWARLEGVFPCNVCGQVFRYQNHKDAHVKEHERNFPYKCTDCDRRFQTLAKLNFHIVTHTDYKAYECEMCGQKFRHQVSLRRHKERHSQEKRYLCPECGKCFREYTSFLIHTKVHKKKGYICNVCHREFARGMALKYHLELHATEKPYVCDKCGEQFAAMWRLNRHITCKHVPEKAFGCDICEKRFSLKKHMLWHRKMHFVKKNPQVKNKKSSK